MRAAFQLVQSTDYGRVRPTFRADPSALLGVLGVGLAAAGLRQTATDHVADGQDRGVEPHLVRAKRVGMVHPVRTLAAVAGKASDQDPDQHHDVDDELCGLERRLGFGKQTAGGTTSGSVAAGLNGTTTLRGVELLITKTPRSRGYVDRSRPPRGSYALAERSPSQRQSALTLPVAR